MCEIIFRDYNKRDADKLNQLAIKSFEQYKGIYHPWEEFLSKISKMSDMEMKIIIAEIDKEIVGAVGFVPPNTVKSSYFDTDWASVRMLVVSPEYRGRGVGKQLMNECVKLAKSHSCEYLALHTSPIMKIALAMYKKMGFEKVKDANPIYGVPYSIYTLLVSNCCSNNNDEKIKKVDLDNLDGLICYCFKKSKRELFEAVKNNNEGLIVDEIKAKMKDPGCFCEKANPSGKCCMADIMAFIKAASNE